MISRDAEPIGHRPPYKRVDLSRRLPKVVTRDDVNRTGRNPDPALYDYCHVYDVWNLKEQRHG